MSKMSQLHAELTEQASELGFESLEQALANGYEVDYDNYKLAKHKLGWSETAEYLAKEQQTAHEAWLEERDEVLGGLLNLMVHHVYDYDTVMKAYNFIKEQCHD